MKRKLILTVSLICAVLIMATGCASRTAATVNGTRIYMSELEQKINQSLAQYGIDNEGLEDYIYSMTNDAQQAQDEANAYRDSMLDNVILSKLLMQKASELGLDQLTDNEREQYLSQADATLKSYRDFYRQAAEDAAAKDATIDVESYAEEQYQEFLNMTGITEDSYRQSYIDNEIMGRVYDYYAGQCEVTEDDYKAYYDSLVEEQKSLDESDPDQALYYYLNNGYDIPVYIPKDVSEKVKTVEHILIAIDDETMDKIYETRYGGEDDAEEKADKMTEEALEKIRPEAEEVLKQLEEGADFEQLMQEVSADYHDGENTYDVYEGSNFVESFVEASMGLENVGDMTGLVSSEYGWHIIRLVGSPTPGEIPYDDVKSYLESVVKENKTAEYWQDTLNGWLEEANVERITFLKDSAE